MAKSSTAKTSRLSDTQLYFYVGKKKLEELERKEKEEGLTPAESRERDEILQKLLGKIIRYGIDLARKRMGKYRKDTDAYQDVQQSLATIFFEKLPFYDPTLTAPTTFFSPYFKQVITEYILQYSQHMSQYDAHNVALVRGAERYFESQGITWDEPMIATKTGLSPKVVKRTLQLAQTSIRASVEDSYDMASSEPTPEEYLLKDERSRMIWNALKDSLSPEDLEFFLYKVNLDGKRERTMQQVADELGMQVRDVKKRYAGIIARLNTNRDIQSCDGRRRGGARITVTLHDGGPGGEDGELFLSGLENVPLHNEGSEGAAGS